MDGFKKKIIGTAVAVTMGAGGLVTIDQIQLAIPIECDVQKPVVAELNKKLRTYKVDKGLALTREMNASDRAAIKGCEAAKADIVGVHQRDNVILEVTEVRPIENGVEVFARAWTRANSITITEGTTTRSIPADSRIAFGKDGTVDIERFRIINPPILVPDEKGDVLVAGFTFDEAQENLIETNRTFREDPKEALLQIIEQNIPNLKNIHTSEKIVVGKLGKTTTTVYPAAGANSPVDGQLNSPLGASTWQTLRDATTASFDGEDLAMFPITYLRTSGTTPNLMVRGVVMFDTSSIPDADVIDSATLSLYISSISNADGHGGMSAAIVSLTSSSNSTLAASDYNITNFGSRVAADTAMTSYVLNEYKDHAFTDLTAINKTGISKFGTLTNKEVDNTAPTLSSTITASIAAYTADQSGTTNDPKLVVEHSASSERRIIRTTSPQ